MWVWQNSFANTAMANIITLHTCIPEANMLRSILGQSDIFLIIGMFFQNFDFVQSADATPGNGL